MESSKLNSVWQFATPANIKFGRSSSQFLPAELQRLQLSKPLLVTDQRLLSLPQISMLVEQLRSVCQVAIYDGCIAEPPTTNVDDAIEVGRRAAVDSVVAIGGGSNMDVAKMVATVLKHGGRSSDYFGFDRVPSPILPVIALPTTAGTGSEVSHSSVLTDSSTQMKVSSLSRWLRPSVAIVDPSLTDSCPPQVTAHSGIDALVHAIEAYTNRDYRSMVGVDPQARAYEGSYPLTRLLAAEAIRLVGRFAVRAFTKPDDFEARDGMSFAAMLAGMAFSNSGVGLVHALEYPVGVLTHCSHGEGNGLLLPHVLSFHLPACVDRLAEVAQLLGCPAQGTPHSQAEQAIEAVVSLQHALSIRTQLSQLGLHKHQIPIVAQRAFQIKRLMDVSARQPTEADLIEILEAAF